VGGPQAQDDPPGCATGRACGNAGGRGLDVRRLETHGGSLHAHQTNSVRRDGPAGGQQAAGADVHDAVRPGLREEAAEKRAGIEGGGTLSSAAGVAGGDGDGAVLKRDEAPVGEGDYADRRGERGEGRLAVGRRLAVHVPGEGPDVGRDAVEAGMTGHLLFEEGAGKRREGWDGDQEVDACGEPRGVVFGEPTARDEGVERGRGLERSTPGREESGETGQGRAEEALVVGEAFAGRGRGLAPGRGGEGLRRAEEGAEGLRDRAGAAAVRPGKLFVQGLMEPLRGCVMLTLWTGPGTTGVMDAGLFATALALRAAGAIMAGAAMHKGAPGTLGQRRPRYHGWWS
jgi:hypothetical protein